MKMKVVDQLHLSAVSRDTMPAGHEFEVSDDLGGQLAAKGLAVPINEMAGESQKSEPPPQNKAEPAPDNKAQKGRGRKRSEAEANDADE